MDNATIAGLFDLILGSLSQVTQNHPFLASLIDYLRNVIKQNAVAITLKFGARALPATTDLNTAAGALLDDMFAVIEAAEQGHPAWIAATKLVAGLLKNMLPALIQQFLQNQKPTPAPAPAPAGGPPVVKAK